MSRSFLSNDATAVVLTPAVYAATRPPRSSRCPISLVCAFIANAASFVLPISNPANLVVFGPDMPPLVVWLRLFALPSVVAIIVTYLVLRLTQRRALDAPVAAIGGISPLTFAGKLAAWGIVMTAVVLIVASALGAALGLPTFVAGAVVTMLVLLLGRQSPWPVLRDISWSVLPLVAGLFILVEGLNRTGVLPALAQVLKRGAAVSPQVTAWIAGIVVAIASNLVNNLPVGLIAATTRQAAQVPAEVTGAILIGVDLGPNLSVTGSLATILWLIALRREGETCSAVQFLKIGAAATPPALARARRPHSHKRVLAVAEASGLESLFGPRRQGFQPVIAHQAVKERGDCPGRDENADNRMKPKMPKLSLMASIASQRLPLSSSLSAIKFSASIPPTITATSTERR